MASSIMKGSLRQKTQGPYYKRERNGELTQLKPMRPGKTAEDKRIGAWVEKSRKTCGGTRNMG